MAAAYVAATLVLTYPLAANFCHARPGTNVDEYTFLWNIWWFRHAIFDLGADPFTATTIFHPLGVSLAFYTLAIFNDIVALPLTAPFGLIVASNSVLIFSLALSGYGAFCLVRDLLAEDAAPGGGSPPPLSAVWSMPSRPAASSTSAWATTTSSAPNGSPSTCSSSCGCSRTVAKGRQAVALERPVPLPAVMPPLAGLCLFLALLTEMTFGVFLLLLSLLFCLHTAPACASAAPSSSRAGVLVAARRPLHARALLPVPRSAAGRQGFNFPGWGYADVLSADLVGSGHSHPPPPLLWAAAADRLAQIHGREYGLYRLRRAAAGADWPPSSTAGAWPSGLAGAVSFTRSGPGPGASRQRSVPVRSGWADGHPAPALCGLSLHPDPEHEPRAQPVQRAALALSGGAGGFAVAWLMPGSRARIRTAVPSSAAWPGALDGLSIPLPLTDARVPAVYAEIAAGAGDFAILPLPLGWRESFGTLGAEQTQIQYYQTVHGKRLINGNTSRVTPNQVQYFEQIGLIASIMDEEMYTAG